MDIKKDILWRVYLCFLAITMLSLVVLGRTFYIQRVEGKYWKAKGDSLHLKYMPIAAERGTIFSEDGNMLSTSVPIFDVFVDFGAEGLQEKKGERFTKNIDSLSSGLASLFKDKSAGEYKRQLEFAYKNKDRYYPLKKKISFTQYKALRDFPLVRLGRNKSGFIFNARDQRINPYVLLANRTIGLSRLDSNKNVGLERTYDSLLKGSTGERLMRYMAGAYVPVDGAEVDPENGKDIVTTLDTYMQDVAENALLKMLKENNSIHGTAMVMETATGKIKAIANLGQQKNADGSIKIDVDGKSVYKEDLNYGIGKSTEPGSVFKLVTLMSLMEDGYVNKNTIVDCNGGAKYFNGLRIKDSHSGLGKITVKEAFFRSSNVAFASMADQFYQKNPARFTNNIHKYRLDVLTGVDITASSARPTVKKKGVNASWSGTTLPYMAHGYEVLLTPLHLLTFYNAVANNGKLMRPYLVNAVKEYGVEVKKIEPQVMVEKICSNEVLAQLKDCLSAVIDSLHGTGHKVLYDSAYKIAGKTGTAVTALNNKGYNKGNKIYQASFIGYFPADKPMYTMAVVIQNSNQSKLFYGADVSGKVFKEISDRIYGRYLSTQKYKPNNLYDSTLYNFYGINSDLKFLFNTMKTTYTETSNSGYLRSIQYQNKKAIANNISTDAMNMVPNVMGMGLKDAVYVLENKGLKLGISGRGKVINQSLNPGTIFKKGQTITLLLN